MFNKTSTRSTEEIACDFAELVEEGRALLGEALDRPSRKMGNLRQTFDDVGKKLAEFQTSATRAAQQGLKQGSRQMRQADQYVRDNAWWTLAGGILVGVAAAMLWSQRR